VGTSCLLEVLAEIAGTVELTAAQARPRAALVLAAPATTRRAAPRRQDRHGLEHFTAAQPALRAGRARCERGSERAHDNGEQLKEPARRS
jgi:hypothetical protein